MGVLFISWLGWWVPSWREGKFANRQVVVAAPCAAELWTSRKFLMDFKSPPGAPCRSLSCWRAQRLWAPWPDPGSTGTLAAGESRGWLSLFGHKSQQGILVGILRAFFTAPVLSRHKESQLGCKDCWTPRYMYKLYAWKQRDNPKF